MKRIATHSNTIFTDTSTARTEMNGMKKKYVLHYIENLFIF